MINFVINHSVQLIAISNIYQLIAIDCYNSLIDIQGKNLCKLLVICVHDDQITSKNDTAAEN